MLQTILRTVVSSPLMRARITNGINAASIAAGAWTMSHLYDWLAAHATFFSTASNAAIAGTVAAGAAGLILTVGSGAFSAIVDPANVNAKVIAAAATGDVAAANDAGVVKAVRAAVAATPGTPAALDELVAKLSKGAV